eukprot:scaffold190399_cov18-Tisochrysis_lutea.AAC.1
MQWLQRGNLAGLHVATLLQAGASIDQPKLQAAICVEVFSACISDVAPGDYSLPRGKASQ